MTATRLKLNETATGAARRAVVTGVRSARPAPRRRSLTVVVPTRHEAENLPELVKRLGDALNGRVLGWEVLFVDDSDDDTPEVIRRLENDGHPIRLIHRPAPMRSSGLSGAVLTGFLNAPSDVIAVMDADLQHPPEVLAELVQPLLDGDAEISVASRYADGGSGGGLDGQVRRIVSMGSRLVSHAIFARARETNDPCSGFFAFKSSVIDGVNLRPEGWKILLEVIVRGRWDTLCEVPYEFGVRCGGESKASVREGVNFGRHLVRLYRDLPQTASGKVLIDLTGQTPARMPTIPAPVEATAPRLPFWVLVSALTVRRAADMVAAWAESSE